MTITFYNYAGEPATIRKQLGTGYTITGSMRGPLDAQNPYITAENIPGGANYAYIAELGAYYYMDPKDIIRTGICGVQLRRDPLMTFATQILALPAIAARAQTDDDRYSSYLIDTEQRMYAYKTICTRLMHTFEYGDYILITAG
jgi:hypothetical protein